MDKELRLRGPRHVARTPAVAGGRAGPACSKALLSQGSSICQVVGLDPSAGCSLDAPSQ